MTSIEPLTDFLTYFRHAFRHLSWEYWLLLGVLALAVAAVVWRRKGYSIYASVVLGLAVFMGSYMLGAMVLKRIGVQIEQHPGLDIAAEYHRIVHGDAEHRAFMLFNVLVFIPFGVALSEFLSAAKRLEPKRIVGLVALTALLLSLCIESLQWTLRVGLFELTDMVLNTLGAAIGAAVALGARAVVRASTRKKSLF